MSKRTNLSAVIALALVGTSGFLLIPGSKKVEGAAMTERADQNPAGQKNTQVKTTFACNMLALNAEERRRHLEVAKQLRAETKEVRELPDGYGFRLSSGQPTILLVSEFIARERLCCPFFSFEMVVEPEDGPLWMRLRGADGVKDFIKAEFGLK